MDGRLLGRAPLGPTRDIKPGMVIQADSAGYLPHRYAVKEGDSQLDLKLEPVPPPMAKEPDPPAPSALPEPVKPAPAAEPKAVVKAKPRPPSPPPGKKGDVFDQIRKQM